MSAIFRLLTILVLALTGFFVAGALLGLDSLGPAAAGTVILLIAVRLYSRPTAFELSPTSLDIVFPVRTLRHARDASFGARRVTAKELRRDFGFCLRIGVGGLWGTFGWLWTSRAGLVDVFVTRTDGLVLVTSRDARPLLITPADPDAFVRAVSE
jgi:hypothetical protein